MKEKFDTISLDTIGLAWDRCIEYIGDKNDVEKINDIPYGGGYGAYCRTVERVCWIEIEP